jgi:hypothetical protein
MMANAEPIAARLHKICDTCVYLRQAGAGICDLLGTKLLRLRLKHLGHVGAIAGR